MVTVEAAISSIAMGIFFCAAALPLWPLKSIAVLGEPTYAGSEMGGGCLPEAISPIFGTFQKYETAIKQYLRRFVSRRDEVDDLAQETFLRAFAAESLETIDNPKAFLFRVARNLALNERAKLYNAATDALEDFEDTAVVMDTSQVAADDLLDARRRLRMLAQAVAVLPPQCAKVFMLRKAYGFSYKQIAERLGISVSTAEKHVALGLLRCSEYLRQNGYDIENKADKPSKPQKVAGDPVKMVANLEARQGKSTNHE